MKYTIAKDGAVVFQNIFFDIENGELCDPIETDNYRIVQVSDSYYTAGCDIPEHIQCCELEISYVTYGGVDALTADGAYRLQKGEAQLSFGGECHALSEKRACRFQTLAVDMKSDAARALLKSLRTGERVIKSSELAGALSAIMSELHREGESHFALALDALVSSALLLLVRRDAVCESEISPEELVPRIIHYIDDRFLAIGSLDELSEVFGYSYNHIYKIFKHHTGESIKSYFLRKRMEYAKESLGKGRRVFELSRELGYNTPYNFSRAFKNYYGHSPKTNN